MSPNLLSKPDPHYGDHLRPHDHLDVEVRDIMTPGVVTLPEDASLHHAFRALVTHGVHAVLLVGHSTGKPLGWVTARALLPWAMEDESLACARDATIQDPVEIQPGASVREAIKLLERPGVDQLLVCRHAGMSPEGVLSALDVVALVAR
jgi:CBS domain-containing protein